MCKLKESICSDYIKNNEKLQIYIDTLLKRIAELEAGKQTPSPVVQEKDKHIKSGFWMSQAISHILDCKLVHYPMDGQYWTANKDIWKLLVAWDWVNTKKYAADLWDCENFALLFKGRSDYHFGLNSCGVVIDYSSGHGYNLIVYPDGSVDLFEPQSDTFFSVISRDTSIYGLQEGAILI